MRMVWGSSQQPKLEALLVAKEPVVADGVAWSTVAVSHEETFQNREKCSVRAIKAKQTVLLQQAS